jgi:hypothetical protein
VHASRRRRTPVAINASTCALTALRHSEPSRGSAVSPRRSLLASRVWHAVGSRAAGADTARPRHRDHAGEPRARLRKAQGPSRGSRLRGIAASPMCVQAVELLERLAICSTAIVARRAVDRGVPVDAASGSLHIEAHPGGGGPPASGLRVSTVWSFLRRPFERSQQLRRC